jgi:redox-sensitive bicupin YhaK (pirin superfamily)
MPAVTVDNPLTLLQLPKLSSESSVPRPVELVVTAQGQMEGAGISIRRPFPGQLPLAAVDPFLLLDQAGPTLNGPKDTRGAPWHPHRGIETVSYIIDGEIAHHDSNGGGGIIGEGDTQWMTAGAGILHDELPTERFFTLGGPVHMVQLWVNLPSELKYSHPRYQHITSDTLTLLTTPDGGALIRLIAGDLGPFAGPGVTFTPITYLHATVSPGAELEVPWKQEFSAFAYVLMGRGFAGPELRPVADHQFVVFGPGDHVELRAADTQSADSSAFELLLLGGLPIREPIVSHGPFVMNSRAEIEQAIADYQAGRLGTIPADQVVPRSFA